MFNPQSEVFPKLSRNEPRRDGCPRLQGPGAGPFSYTFLVRAAMLPPHPRDASATALGPFGGGKNSGDAHLDLPRANVKLLQDVDEEVLNLHPGVDAVGAIQDNDDVHVGLAPWEVRNTVTATQGASACLLLVSDSPDDCPMDNRGRTQLHVCNFTCIIPWAGEPSWVGHLFGRCA